MTNTPNTGYWMPDFAYFDYLEERGWNVDELRECEEWCYPFGFCVDNGFDYYDIGVLLGSHNMPECGASYSGVRRLGWFDYYGDGDNSKVGAGNMWVRYD